MKASIVISTKDRFDDLVVAVESCLRQNAGAEIIVIDDGSTDATPTEFALRFPKVNYVRHDKSAGYIVRRNEGARLASGDIIFSIDDDAEFKSPDIVEQVLNEFENDIVGAVAIPLIEPNLANTVFQRAPHPEGIWTTSTFKGTAYAVRRSVFLELGGFRDRLIHQGEEKDFCVRMLEAGFVVRLGRGSAIYHYESPKRDLRRMNFFGRRNDVLFVWQNVPSIYLLPHAAGTIIKGLIFGLRSGHLASHFQGLRQGLTDIVNGRVMRSPVSRASYSRFRALQSAPSLLTK
ncbi:MAG: glycosyltransferase [Erythrobacter sp.]|nr:glycosyltransferase [Erythrobacter sp.]